MVRCSVKKISFSKMSAVRTRTSISPSISSSPKYSLNFSGNILYIFISPMRQDSSVDVATRLRAGRFEVRVSDGATQFSLLQNVLTGSGAQPCLNATGGGFSRGGGGIKRPGRVFDYSPPLQRLKMSRDIRLGVPYSIIVCAGTTLAFTFLPLQYV